MWTSVSPCLEVVEALIEEGANVSAKVWRCRLTLSNPS